MAAILRCAAICGRWFGFKGGSGAWPWPRGAILATEPVVSLALAVVFLPWRSPPAS